MQLFFLEYHLNQQQPNEFEVKFSFREIRRIFPIEVRNFHL